MKVLSRGVLMLLLVMAVGVGCSQKSGTEGQASAPQSEQSESQAMKPAEPAMEQQQATMPDTEQQQPAAAVAAEPQEPAVQSEQAANKPEEITGTVVRTEQGVALFSDTGNFFVDGQQLDQLVGKNVKVTATLAEGTEKPTISVISVSVIEGE